VMFRSSIFVKKHVFQPLFPAEIQKA